jgi:fructose-1,6-bisphosphatase/inositol monophosphatase family enzyme
MLGRLINHVRNIRTTNSLVDFCLTLDGGLGCFINHSTKMWDIAPIVLMMNEAGGQISLINGRNISFSLNAKELHRNYAVLGATTGLYPQVLSLLTGTK